MVKIILHQKINKTYLDINECETKPHACQSPAVCKNTRGSYTCKCPEGYKLAYDGKSCIGRNNSV